MCGEDSKDSGNVQVLLPQRGFSQLFRQFLKTSLESWGAVRVSYWDGLPTCSAICSPLQVFLYAYPQMMQGRFRQCWAPRGSMGEWQVAGFNYLNAEGRIPYERLVETFKRLPSTNNYERVGEYALVQPNVIFVLLDPRSRTDEPEMMQTLGYVLEQCRPYVGVPALSSGQRVTSLDAVITPPEVSDKESFLGLNWAPSRKVKEKHFSYAPHCEDDPKLWQGVTEEIKERESELANLHKERLALQEATVICESLLESLSQRMSEATQRVKQLVADLSIEALEVDVDRSLVRVVFVDQTICMDDEIFDLGSFELVFDFDRQQSSSFVLVSQSPRQDGNGQLYHAPAIPDGRPSAVPNADEEVERLLAPSDVCGLIEFAHGLIGYLDENDPDIVNRPRLWPSVVAQV